MRREITPFIFGGCVSAHYLVFIYFTNTLHKMAERESQDSVAVSDKKTTTLEKDIPSPDPQPSPAPPPANVVELCRETFQKTAEYLQGELDGTIEDYKLLEKMNRVSMTKYSEMKNIALSISGSLNNLNDKYKSLQPYLDQIEDIEQGVESLEKAAYSLDQYSKRLEAKFKALEKR